MRPHRRQPTRLPRPWDSPGKNTGVGCHFLLRCMKVKVRVKSLSRVQLLMTPWSAAHQAPPSMGFSRQEYWSGVPLPSCEELDKTEVAACMLTESSKPYPATSHELISAPLTKLPLAFCFLHVPPEDWDEILWTGCRSLCVHRMPALPQFSYLDSFAQYFLLNGLVCMYQRWYESIKPK